jgi:hypothetical protein
MAPQANPSPGGPLASWPTWGVPAALAAVLAFPALTLSYLFDDYDFLGRGQVFNLRQLLPDPQALFWRPLSREAYFGFLYAVAPTNPVVAHMVNALLLALAAALVALLGTRLMGRRAGFFAGTAFACLGAAPALVGWVSCDQDLFAIVFALAALHLELSGRTPLALLATALALLSKETAVALVPAIALIRPLSGRAPARSAVVPAVAYGLLVVVWGAVHPGIRGLLTHRFESSDPAVAYLSAARADLAGSMAKVGRTLVNVPIQGAQVAWPVELDMVLPFAIGVLALGIWMAWRSGSTDSTANVSVGRILLLAALLTLPAIVVVAGLVKILSPYYAVLAGIGTSLAIGLGLARAPRILAAALTVAFLGMGFACRGMDLGPSVPTERTLKGPSDRLAKLEHSFRQVLPRIEGPTRLLVSVQAPDDRDLALHLIRLQVARIWYRNPKLDTMYPERLTAGRTPEILAWVSQELSVYAIDPATLGVTPSGMPDSSGYRTTLRAYARGLAGSGQTDRAVELLLRMKTGEEWEAAYNRRLAGALLLAAGRKAEADRILEDMPRFNRNDAIAIVYEVASIPSSLDLDAAILDAVGLGASDAEAIRSVLRQLALSRYPAATIRFATRLLALRPGDSEARTVLQMLQRGEDASRVTIPVEHDIPW